MKKNWKRAVICAAIVLGSVLLTLAMEDIPFFQLVDLKAQDAHFVLRGPLPTKDILIVGIDDKALNHFPELFSFWQPYYADAIKAAADGGAKTFVLDVTFLVNVAKYSPDDDSLLAQAYSETMPRMPVVCAFVPGSLAQQQDPQYAVPLNMLASAFGTSAFANLTVDGDDFVRKQVLIEEPKAGVPTEALRRGMALRAAEKFLGQDAEIRDGKLYLAGRQIPMDRDRNLTINYAGPADTFPRVSLYDVVTAYRAGNRAQLDKWMKGKAVLLGPDDNDDRHATPFYTAFTLSKKWRTAGVEIHANALRTLLTGEFLRPVPDWARTVALTVAATLCVVAVTSFAVTHTALGSTLVLFLLLLGTHLLFRRGMLLSTSQMLLAFAWALLGGVIYRFATAEKKSSFFKSAVALFVGRQVASSLEEKQEISLVGKREMVTILFTDIRGFTAFCESKDPAVVVDLLNVYMGTMVSIIVKYGGHVNKFIGDGILAVFSDDDPGAQPGDHALRTVKCATEMVEQVIGEFRTGAGLHSGEVVIGNVGSSDKLEFTVLGNTVNLASRLESLNKDQKTRLLMSEESLEMLGGAIDTIYLGAVPVKGKTEKMKLFTVTALLEESRVRELGAEQSFAQTEHVA
ncbi:MAG: adenylate/guanylate cyclase domain-containing protein [Bryobacteraceae bacterium]|jgi:adenylate cyclase